MHTAELLSLLAIPSNAASMLLPLLVLLLTILYLLQPISIVFRSHLKPLPASRSWLGLPADAAATHAAATDDETVIGGR